MEQKLSRILVPTDFSTVAESAISHAAVIAKKTGDEIWLMHVIDKNSKADLKKQQAGVESLDERLRNLCKQYESQYKVSFNYVLKEGNIFTTIGEVAEEVKANLMVMGTHGVQGIQKLVGAYALKVVTSSKVPVIIVQEKGPQSDTYSRIVSPIDGSVETKQKTLQTIGIAKIFGAKVFLFKQKGYDEYLDNIIQRNLNFVIRHLEEQNITTEVVEQESAKGDFAKDFLHYSTRIQADVIITLTTPEKGLKDMLVGPVEQAVINNEQQIPVMCVRPLQHLYKTERLASIVNLSF